MPENLTDLTVEVLGYQAVSPYPAVSRAARLLHDFLNPSLLDYVQAIQPHE